MTRSIVSTPNAPSAIGTYSQAVRSGDTLYLSGQIGLDPATGQLVDGVETRIHRVFQNLKAVAEGADASLGDVVKLTVYLTTWRTSPASTKRWRGTSASPIPRARSWALQPFPRGALVRSRRHRRAPGLRNGSGPSRAEGSDRFSGAKGSSKRKARTGPPAPGSAGKTIAAKLAKLGIVRDFDLVLHLPLRYEDETRITPISDATPGAAVQVEGTVRSTEIVYRPKRQLVSRLEDATGELVLRFFNFYGSQAKALERGRHRTRIRRGSYRLLRRRDDSSPFSSAARGDGRFRRR